MKVSLSPRKDNKGQESLKDKAAATGVFSPVEWMIETRDLGKTYGDCVALERLNLTVGAGEIYGLLAPVGAGRSTLLNVLAAIIPPSQGEARVAGWSVRENPGEVRTRIGIMPGLFGTYAAMRTCEYLEFFGLAYHVAPGQLRTRMEELLALAGLEEQRNAFIATLSPEQRQRLALIKTMLHDPAVLLLDDPALGLEPAARVRIRELLGEIRRRGKTILIGSNLVLDLVGVCDRIGMLHRGRLTREGPAGELLRELGGARRIELEVRGEAAAARAAVQSHPGVREVLRQARGVVFSLEDARLDPEEVIGDLARKGVAITAWREHEVQVKTPLAAGAAG
jgi:ABC-2 type transport system ATP-binding protein